MDVDIARFGDAHVRLKRVHGQVGEVIATVMRQCVVAGDPGTRSLDEAQLERLFLSLA